ncbi:MAG TPA: ABC transporter permease [Cyclobacteriaceae bacterium]|nr:ABC transporter permease [Cyclobacteriaceae bacterium]
MPPRLFLHFFRWYCHQKLVDHIEGDLLEVYNERLRTKGKRKADWRFVVDVVFLFRPAIIKPTELNRDSNLIGMFLNNFKITTRSLWKNKASSFINVFGLTVGLSSCLLIYLYVAHEFSFDTFQEKGARIARVIMEYSFEGSPETKRGNFTSTKVAPVFARTFPEVESSVRMTDADMVIHQGDNLIKESNFLFTDSTFFKIFTCEMLEGNPGKALDGPYKVVLTESTSKKYFGTESPLGKLVMTGTGDTPYEVTGVIKDYPSNSQIKFDFLASFSSLGENQNETYWDANYTTYLLLTGEHSIAPLQEKVTAFMKTEMAGSGASVNFLLEPFDKIHLHSQYAAFTPNINIAYLYILSAVAVLILLIVCFTYINLSIARSVNRAREVGVRKVVGAARSQIFWQFISESLILTFVAMLLSITIAVAALPSFNQLTGKQLIPSAFYSTPFLLFAITLTATVSLLAGGYPAAVLSGFQPVKVLKGVFKNSNSGRSIQQSLIVFQFAISVFLIVCTLIIQKQLYFIQNKNLGYDRNHVLVLPMNEKMLPTIDVIKKEFKTNVDVLQVSRCVSPPVKIAGGYNMRSSAMPENEQIAVTATPVDEDYIKTAGLQIIAGEDLTEQDSKDVTAEGRENRIYHFILNESAARQLGWTPGQAIGKRMFMGGDRSGFVRGVIKDFHFESMHQTIGPLVLFTEMRGRQLMVKVRGRGLTKTISFLQAKWKKLVPDLPFEYHFMDDDYSSLYRSELQLGKVMNLFSALAIVLACLGLFGLSSYMAQQRIKEIGIRKILGASWSNVVTLLSVNFIKLVAVAIIIAAPVAHYMMTQWLQGFVYAVEIRGWVFIVSGLVAISIAFVTVSFHGIKAASMNPSKALRTE